MGLNIAVLANLKKNAPAYEGMSDDAWDDLDGPVTGSRPGRELNLRWILTHLVEEYARHLGHMDLLREVVDGRTGY